MVPLKVTIDPLAPGSMLIQPLPLIGPAKFRLPPFVSRISACPALTAIDPL